MSELQNIIEVKEIKTQSKQRDQVLAKLKELQMQYPKGIRPVELAVLLQISSPTVRRILGEYEKLGLVTRERITRNCSMFKVVL